MIIGRGLLRRMFAIAKFDHTKDYYRILNLSNNASEEQIKQSYKELAKKYHPDVNKGKGEIFKEIN
jgi:curved DNA-binding protein CbpA